jgi:NAD(P)-dependent dehydrogenase (short-subunit alcohol dehydrogenase family)
MGDLTKNNQGRLAGRNAIIAGGGRGIGRAITKGFAREGASVAVASLQMGNAEKVAKEISEQGGRAIALQVDVARADSVQSMVDQAVDHFGRIHILVHNAGVNSMTPMLELSEEEWDWLMDINLKGIFLVGKAVGRHMAAAGGGVIINVTSQGSEVAIPHKLHYCASKGGAKLLTKAMALDLAPHKIRVNALGPGVTDTDMTRKRLSDPDIRRWSLERIPLGRLGQPEEMVGAAIFLASDDSAYVTGTTVIVDGGYLAR